MSDEPSVGRPAAAPAATAPLGGLASVGTLPLRLLDGLLRRRGIGRLRVRLPGGAEGVIGEAGSPVEASLEVRAYAAVWKVWRRGALGFAESYMDGDFETADLRRLFELYLANEPALTRAFPRLNLTRGLDRRFHASRQNTYSGSRRNIAEHYDLGNAFYRLWLDPSMLYSSGIYTSDTASLEEAQAEKIGRILAALELLPEQSVLEVGCGWGALAAAMAERGARVRAITISAEQLAEARARIGRAGLSEVVETVFEDYRDTVGGFDRLVSIEMIEAVGEENWPLFFGTIADRLNPGGTAVIQAITIREDAFASYRANPDFIQRYIFPGGMLPTVKLMHQRASEAGLSFEIVERFGHSYALTLAEWRRRFEHAWPQIAALGFDERFRRMWRYYLTYCEIGFERGLIDVGLYRLRKA
ncbi:MAG TPA: cyclopropane-fatty-acyl-phospholipid synthase family protein [Hyphomicrobiaceae bacterium]|nr:cyclopropane-fatty-acyl-phospholipid synthase family protein [Hyphomicrobiaceae bacterium]